MIIITVSVWRFTELYKELSLHLVHDSQEFTEGQTESSEGVTVFKLQGQTML